MCWGNFAFIAKLTGGSGEIRTHGGLASSPVFKTGAFNRSATLPSATQAKCLFERKRMQIISENLFPVQFLTIFDIIRNDFSFLKGRYV